MKLAMGRVIILFVITVFCLTKLGDTKTIDNLQRRHENIIHKCCPVGQYVAKRKNCTDSNVQKDFKHLKVYTKDIVETGSSVEDYFIIWPGKFKNDPEFRGEAILWSQLGYAPYVIEDGGLQLEKPNLYRRWNPVQNGNFCVDYDIANADHVSPVPGIWAIIEDESFVEKNIYLSYAMLVSCFFMLLVLIVYALLPELRNLCGMILMAYVASLFMAFLLLATLQLSVNSVPVCVGLSMSVYFFLLASFCWMSVMSYDIWWTFRGYAKARLIHRRGENYKFLMYCLYASGVPFLMTIALGVLNGVDMRHLPWLITPHIPEMGCFLEDGQKLVYLYIPMLILIICNWVFYLMTAFNVWRLNRGTACLDSAAAGTPAAHRTQRQRFMVYLKLSVVMGLNWLFEIVSFVYPDLKMWYISDAYNVLIGLAIFLIFVWKKKIYRMLYKRYAKSTSRMFYRGSSKNTVYGSSSLDSNSETSTLQVSNHPKGFNGYSGSMKNIRNL